MSKDPRNDPQPGDVLHILLKTYRVIDRNRHFVTVSDGQFALRYTIRAWRDVAKSASSFTRAD